MKPFSILVVDDEKDIVNAIDLYLQNEELTILKAYNGKEALDILAQEEVHLILMDVMMPVMNGIQATKEIRKNYSIPIIMLTAKSEDQDIILGLNIGADDYIIKPFNFLELIARVKSNLRRYIHYDNYQKEDEVLEVRGLVLNKKNKSVCVNEVPVRLTPIEFKILQLLMAHPNQIFSIQQIYEHVWGEVFYNGENTVSVHIRRIREKIEINPKEPIYLKVVWGVGYKIEK